MAESENHQDEEAAAKQAEFEARVAEWDRRIKEVEVEFERSRAIAEEEAKKLLARLRQRRDEADTQLEKLKETSDEAWSRTKSIMDNTLEEISAAYEALRKRMKQ